MSKNRWIGSKVRRLLLVGSCLAGNAAQAQPGLEAEAAIRDVIERYAQGTYDGDAEKLRGAFHPKAVMNGYLTDELLLTTPDPFIEKRSKAPLREAGVRYEWEITSLQVAGKVASVTLKEEGGNPAGSGYTNYFHLIDDGDGWRIISKLFTEHPASE